MSIHCSGHEGGGQRLRHLCGMEPCIHTSYISISAKHLRRPLFANATARNSQSSRDRSYDNAKTSQMTESSGRHRIDNREGARTGRER